MIDTRSMENGVICISSKYKRRYRIQYATKNPIKFVIKKITSRPRTHFIQPPLKIIQETKYDGFMFYFVKLNRT